MNTPVTHTEMSGFVDGINRRLDKADDSVIALTTVVNESLIEAAQERGDHRARLASLEGFRKVQIGTAITIITGVTLILMKQ